VKPPVLKSSSAEFKEFLAAIVARRGGDSAQLDVSVASIIADVRERGDVALIEYTLRFDRVQLTPKTLRVSAKELRDALARLPNDDRRALELAAKRIRAFHKKTVEKPFSYTDAVGMRLGQLVRPLDRVGIYVPGGMGAYPSSVLMNAIPARVAGVR
jgi:histidinol dehydrogenase